MIPITTRETGDSAKGSPLTNLELDTNFLNIQSELQTLEDTKEQVGEAIMMALALG